MEYLPSSTTTTGNFDFLNSAFSQCDFQDCEFMEVDFSDLEAYQCQFKRCSFIKSMFNETEISQTIFRSCCFEESEFQQAHIHDCKFVDSQFRNIAPKGSPALLQDSKFINMANVITLQGIFDFDKIIAFLNSDPSY